MKILIKCGIMLVLILLLCIPLIMVGGVVSERKSNRYAVINDIASSYGKQQTVITPIITADYTQVTVTKVDGKNLYDQTKGFFNFTPETVDLAVDMDTELKHRNLYSTVTYSAMIDMTGRIVFPDSAVEFFKSTNIKINSVTLNFEVSDKKGIKKVPEGHFADKPLEFLSRQTNSYSSNGYLFAVIFDSTNESQQSYVKRIIEFADMMKKGVTFDLKLQLNGTESFSIIPTGQDTYMTMRANWAHPSFYGFTLPDNKTITDTNFEAEWHSSWISGHYYSKAPEKVTNLNRTIGSDYSFGIKFIDKIDNYKLTDRSLKYGFVIIVLTFMMIFVIEKLKKCMIHPVQYAFIGFSLAIFFLLLLSFSEQISFLFAYISGGVACIALITGYIGFIFRNRKTAMLFACFLSVLYMIMYMLLNISDYALLIGSITLFIILGSVMIATRNVDWYDSNQ